jgi:hypothetical protein
MSFEPLDGKLRDAGLAPLFPRQPWLLSTLAHNPRSFAWSKAKRA